MVDNDSGHPSTADVELGARTYLASSDITLPSVLTGDLLSGGLDIFSSQFYSLDSNTGDKKGDWSPDPPDGASYTGGIYSDTLSGSVLSADYSAYMGSGSYDPGYCMRRFS